MNETIAQLIKQRPARMLTDVNGKPSGYVLTMPCRLHFPALAAPSKVKDSPGEPKFGVTLLIPVGADVSLLRRLVGETARTKFDVQNGAEYEARGYRNPFRSQLAKAKFDGFSSDPSALFISATTMKRPGCFGQGGASDIIDPSTDALYAGCWVIARVNTYSYDKAGNKGVAFGLSAVQKVADDTRLSIGGGDSSDGIEAVPAAVAAAGGVAPVNSAGAPGGW